MPGNSGGRQLVGEFLRPSLDYLFVNVSEVGAVGLMQPQPAGAEEAYLRSSKWGNYARFWDDHHYPCQQPPWGDLNAIDLKTGKLAWKVPLGVMDDLEARGVPKTGTYNLGGSIATAGGLVFIGGTDDHRFRAFDAKTGKELWVDQLESNAHATPMTYMGKKSEKAIRGGRGGSGRIFQSRQFCANRAGRLRALPQRTRAGAAASRRLPANDLCQSSAREPQELPAPASPIVQPIPFSHRRHVQAGFQCDTCHQPAGTSGKMQIPGAAECMTCHATIKRGKPGNPETDRAPGRRPPARLEADI